MGHKGAIEQHMLTQSQCHESLVMQHNLCFSIIYYNGNPIMG